MREVRLIALGSYSRSDDAAALLAAAEVHLPAARVIEAGRPGAGLLDLLDGDSPVLLADVTQSQLAPGAITIVELNRMADIALATGQVSSHGFGVAEALKLAASLGRPLPRGAFVGLEAGSFEPSETLSAPVGAALERYIRTLRETALTLGTDRRVQTATIEPECTNPA